MWPVNSDRSIVFLPVARLPKNCKMIAQESKMRNTNLYRALDNKHDSHMQQFSFQYTIDDSTDYEGLT